MTTEEGGQAKDEIDEQDEIDVIDVEWSFDNKTNTPLLCRIYIPPFSSSNSKPHPAILDVHGGTWSSKDRTLDVLCNTALAKAGYIVFAIDFRQGGDKNGNHTHPAASIDVRSALNWIRLTPDIVDRYNVDVENVGLIGSSSGGHLVLHVGLNPNSTELSQTQDETDILQVKPPKFIIALWPVADPHARYRYAKRAKLQHLVSATEGYFGTEDDMKRASIPHMIDAMFAATSSSSSSFSKKIELPPLLVIQPGEDGNVPNEITQDLLRAYRSYDGYYETVYFPGEPHAFGLRESENTSRMNDVLIGFAKRYTD